ncbi:hypothetical protein C0J52_27934 [Blattella germanica]|nr:hypothetical protein C0J52_27934 [Blattella germanica]
MKHYTIVTTILLLVYVVSGSQICPEIDCNGIQCTVPKCEADENLIPSLNSCNCCPYCIPKIRTRDDSLG